MKRSSLTALRIGLFILLTSLASVVPLVPSVRHATSTGLPANNMSGVGPHPTPPTGFVTLAPLTVPTVITVSAGSSSGPWVVKVRNAFGALVSSGMTDRGGNVMVDMPVTIGLMLDVLGTDAVDVPVFAGHDVEVWLP